MSRPSLIYRGVWLATSAAKVWYCKQCISLSVFTFSRVP